MKRIRVLHVTYNDVSGGAARFVMRLHEALLRNNIDSIVLVLNKESDNKCVIRHSGNFLTIKIMPRLEKLLLLFYKNKKSKFSPGLFNASLIKDINKISPDIVHLHWINEGTISIPSLRKIDKPIIWSLLDMWPFTGGCHYDFGCNNYLTGCGACPALGSKKHYDLSRYLYVLKNRIYNSLSLRIVAISHWLKACVVDNSAMSELSCQVIFPPLNLNYYRPLNQTFCRNLFRLPQNKKLILFGSINSTADKRKGFQVLLKALKIIENKNISKDIELIVFGATNGNISDNTKIKINFVGRLMSGYGIHDDASLAALYSAADLTVVPSLQEAFGQTASESIACGVPVVGFNKTGVEDIVDHKKTGYLAENNSAGDLARGICWVLNNDQKVIRKYCREKAKEKFDDNLIARKYINLYKESLI